MCPPLAACLTTCVLAKQNHLILKCRKWFWNGVCTLLTCSQGFSCFDIHPFRLSKLPEVSLWMISRGKRRFHIIVQAIYDMNHLVLVSHRSIACGLKPRHVRFVFLHAAISAIQVRTVKAWLFRQSEISGRQNPNGNFQGWWKAWARWACLGNGSKQQQHALTMWELWMKFNAISMGHLYHGYVSHNHDDKTKAEKRGQRLVP